MTDADTYNHSSAVLTHRRRAGRRRCRAGSDRSEQAERHARFAVIGDSGTGDNNQYRLAKVFTDIHQRFPYEFVLMMGDNMYGGENARDFQRKFEIPYKPVLDKGVKFYASLGNHDSHESADVQAVQHERRAVLHLQAETRRPVLRARQQLHGSHAAAMAGERAGGERLGLEDHVLPSSDLLVGRVARVRHRAARSDRAAVPQIRRGRRAWQVTSISTNG